jgi:D-xylose 1-dehydrogenase (NADP+, D-xylono-1,5-lactone-forming)
MTVRWGFVGAGWIAQQAMAAAVHASRNGTLQAAASRDPGRATRLAPRTVHARYADLVADPDVDAVYVCLANHLHEEWAVRALRAGKHVLCEKPLAIDAEQAVRMARAAQESGRLLVEAAWCRWHPRFRRLAALATGGQLGALVSVDSAFTFPAAIDGNYRSAPECGGGALLDVGGYQVHAWQAVKAAAADIRIRQVARTQAATGVDATTRIRATLGSGTRATAVASFAMPEHQYLVVSGSEAVARMGEGAAFTSWREPTTLVVGDTTERFPAVDAYQLMVEAVADRIEGLDSWCVPLTESVAVAEVLDAVRDFAVAS